MSAGSQPATLARAGARGSEVVGTSASWKVCPRAGAGLELEEGALSSEPEWATGELGPGQRRGAPGPPRGGRKGVRGAALCLGWTWAGSPRPQVLWDAQGWARSPRRPPAPGRLKLFCCGWETIPPAGGQGLLPPRPGCQAGWGKRGLGPQAPLETGLEWGRANVSRRDPTGD